MKKIAVDLPYPNLDQVTVNYKDAKVIAPAYAGLSGEITAILQYVNHRYYFENADDEETANVLTCISLAEMEHLELLGKALYKLGVAPVFSQTPPYTFCPYDTSAIRYASKPQKMLMEDITSELIAIDDYEKMLKNISNENVYALISRIILDEQLHVRVLKERLEKISQKNS